MAANPLTFCGLRKSRWLALLCFRHRFTKKSVVSSADFVAANQRSDIAANQRSDRVPLMLLMLSATYNNAAYNEGRAGEPLPLNPYLGLKNHFCTYGSFYFRVVIRCSTNNHGYEWFRRSIEESRESLSH